MVDAVRLNLEGRLLKAPRYVKQETVKTVQMRGVIFSMRLRMRVTCMKIL